MNTFKSILWTVLGIVVFIAIIKFFIFLLPFIIVIGIVGYIVFKCNKKRENESYNYYNNNQNSYEESNIDDSDNGEIIDVDYKEVDK